jgi:predicted lipid-binding transport protein (Tim44 family)
MRAKTKAKTKTKAKAKENQRNKTQATQKQPESEKGRIFGGGVIGIMSAGLLTGLSFVVSTSLNGAAKVMSVV